MTTSHPKQDDPSYVTITDTFIESTNRLTADDASDYGDFGNNEEELQIVEQLLTQVASKSDEQESLLVTDIEDYEPPRGVRLPKVLGFEQTRVWEIAHSQRDSEVLHDLQDTSAVKKNEFDNGATRETVPATEPETQTLEPDLRSPLERFRRPPKKAFSVTDLVSPAWCELQYFYTLTKLGRKKRTPAMKQGTKVHQQLEAEIHITVPVEVTKREDSFGLRIWNMIQGLRTLRDTGRTRELEVWGTIGGEIVNGIIDELSYECPDPNLEEQLNSKDGKKTLGPVLPEYQTSIADFLQSGTQKENGQAISAALSSTTSPDGRVRKRRKEVQRIYLTDVKTRSSSSLPSGSAVKPTILQLHLYHHLLENLAQGNFS